LPKFRDFDVALSAFLDQSKTGALAQAAQWVGGSPAAGGFYNTTNAYFEKSGAVSFQPFAQKLSMPSDSQVFFHADFHGDIHSLLADLSWLNEHAYLRGFTIARTNFYMIF